MQHCRQNHGAEQREHTAGEVPQRTTLIYLPMYAYCLRNIAMEYKVAIPAQEGHSTQKLPLLQLPEIRLRGA